MPFAKFSHRPIETIQCPLKCFSAICYIKTPKMNSGDIRFKIVRPAIINSRKMTVVTACAAYSLKREAVCISETSVNYQTTQHRILENSTPQFWKETKGGILCSQCGGRVNKSRGNP
jgi:hypothetical protein